MQGKIKERCIAKPETYEERKAGPRISLNYESWFRADYACPRQHCYRCLQKKPVGKIRSGAMNPRTPNFNVGKARIWECPAVAK